MPLTEALDIASTASLYVLLAVLAGAAALKLAFSSLNTATLTRWSATALLIPLILHLILTTMSMADVELSEVIPMLWPVLHQSQIGRLLLAMLGAYALLLLAVWPLFALPQRIRQILAVLAFVSLCWARAASGHAGEEGWLGSAVLIHAGHIIAGTTWLGAIGVYLLRARALDDTTLIKLTHHLSEVATFCLLAILLTGLADALRMYEMSSHFWQSDYARLLLLKLSGVLIAVGLGGFNRLVTMPRLAQHTHAMRQLFYSVAVVESGVLLAVLVLAAKLGQTMPDM